MTSQNKHYSKITIILFFLVSLWVWPFATEAYLKKPERYELSRRQLNKVFKKYNKEHPDTLKKIPVWNPNETLENSLFLWSPVRSIAKYRSIISIFPTVIPEFNIAKYDSVPGDSLGYFMGFKSFTLKELPRESDGYRCISESFSSNYLHICENEDTVINIRAIIDIFPHGDTREREAYISSTDSIVIEEDGVKQNTSPITLLPKALSQRRKLYIAIREWNIDEVASVLEFAEARPYDFSILFFSRSIFKDKHLVDYCGYFCLYPIGDRDDENYLY